MYPRIMKKAGLMFVDRAIHPETMNYIPYNLSFMINEKKSIFKSVKPFPDFPLKPKLLLPMTFRKLLSLLVCEISN